MRLLIANDLDDSIVHKADIRSWAHRILWFVQDGDVLIFMDEPDLPFVDYVTGLLGVDKSTLQFFVLPGEGRFNRRMFDHQLLLDPTFVEQLRTALTVVDEVFALWHSSFVQMFLEELGLGDAWPGGPLYLQNGAECLNGMGNFKMFAAGADVPVAPGSVCRTREDAVFLSERLLRKYPALMIKKAHGGAGAGNLLLTREKSISGDRSGNSRRVEVEKSDPESVATFWLKNWDWASADGRYPVVIERYMEASRSIYVEFFLDARGCHVRELGELEFESRAQAREVVPARSIGAKTRTQLVAAAQRLGDYYHRLGHRGFLSADSVVDDDGDFVFTEVNAQFTGSSHLYNVIGNRLVRAWARGLSVTQMPSPAQWNLRNVDDLIQALEEEGLNYVESSEACILPITPCIADRGVLILAVVLPHGRSPETLLARVTARLSSRTNVVTQ